MADVDISGFWPEWTVGPLIGQGGFGSVYVMSRQEMGLQVHSALKVVTIPQDQSEILHLASQGVPPESIVQILEDRARRLAAEIRTMQSLKTAANVVTVEDFHVEVSSEIIQWQFFIRMELLQSLPDHIRQYGLLGQREAVRMCIDICKALECCETINIIHRDIKPANIFFEKFGSWRLGDFGIARQMQGSTSSTMTSIGTPAYEAPEVTNGKAYDATVDTYSLGLVLYQYLNGGRLPFLEEGMINELTLAAAVSKRLITEELPALPGVDSELMAIVIKACRNTPSARYESAGALRRALEGWLHGNHSAVADTPGAAVAAASAPEQSHALSEDEIKSQVMTAFLKSQSNTSSLFGAQSPMDSWEETVIPEAQPQFAEEDSAPESASHTVGVWDLFGSGSGKDEDSNKGDVPGASVAEPARRPAEPAKSSAESHSGASSSNDDSYVASLDSYGIYTLGQVKNPGQDKVQTGKYLLIDMASPLCRYAAVVDGKPTVLGSSFGPTDSSNCSFLKIVVNKIIDDARTVAEGFDSVLFAVPSKYYLAERYTLIDAAREKGLNTVRIYSRAMCAALGASLFHYDYGTPVTRAVLVADTERLDLEIVRIDSGVVETEAIYSLYPEGAIFAPQEIVAKLPTLFRYAVIANRLPEDFHPNQAFVAGFYAVDESVSDAFRRVVDASMCVTLPEECIVAGLAPTACVLQGNYPGDTFLCMVGAHEGISVRVEGQPRKIIVGKNAPLPIKSDEVIFEGIVPGAGGSSQILLHEGAGSDERLSMRSELAFEGSAPQSFAVFVEVDLCGMIQLRARRLEAAPASHVPASSGASSGASHRMRVHAAVDAMIKIKDRANIREQETIEKAGYTSDIVKNLSVPKEQTPLFLQTSSFVGAKHGLCGTVEAIYYVDYKTGEKGSWSWDAFASLKIEKVSGSLISVGGITARAMYPDHLIKALQTLQQTYRNG